MRQDTVRFLTTTPLRDTPYPQGMTVKVNGWRRGRVVLMRRGFDCLTADGNVGIRHEGSHFTRDPGVHAGVPDGRRGGDVHLCPRVGNGGCVMSTKGKRMFECQDCKGRQLFHPIELSRRCKPHCKRCGGTFFEPWSGGAFDAEVQMGTARAICEKQPPVDAAASLKMRGERAI